MNRLPCEILVNIVKELLATVARDRLLEWRSDDSTGDESNVDCSDDDSSDAKRLATNHLSTGRLNCGDLEHLVGLFDMNHQFQAVIRDVVDIASCIQPAP